MAQGPGQAIAGARDRVRATVAAIVLFLLFLMVFPISVALFPPNLAYAAFTFYASVLGAERRAARAASAQDGHGYR